MKKIFGVIRAPFLLLTPVCVFLGAAVAAVSGSVVQWSNLSIVLVAALAGHISVNALNEYVDFKSGLDAITPKTPFSGGSGVLPLYPDFAETALWVGIVTLVLCSGCGIYLISTAGWGLLPLGIIGALTVVCYTPWINRNAVLCLFAPGVGFGLVMVLGTQYALTSTFTLQGYWAACLPTLLVSNLLLLNQFPDVEADRTVGRSNVPIRMGRAASAKVFGLMLLLAYGSVVVAVLSGVLPGLSLLALLTMPVAGMVFQRVSQLANTPEKLTRWLGLNVALVLTTPVLLGLGIIFSA